MKSLCRLCLRSTDQSLSLDLIGSQNFQQWAHKFLGLEVQFVHGFSTCICTPCFCAFQNWADILRQQAARINFEELANYRPWWKEVDKAKIIKATSALDSSKRQRVKTEEPEIQEVCIRLEEEEISDSENEMSSCFVAIEQLNPTFIENCLNGLVKLSDNCNVESEIENVQESFACRQCQLEFSSSSSLKLHIERMHPEQQNCPNCHMTFSWRRSLTKHLTEKACLVNRTEQQPVYCCPGCASSFDSEIHLSEHMSFSHRRTFGTQKFPCQHCCFVYYSKSQLFDHYMYSHGSKCPLCFSSFPSKLELVTHVANQHPNFRFPRHCEKLEGKCVVCIFCTQKFECEKNVAAHILKYHEEWNNLLLKPLNASRAVQTEEEEIALVDLEDNGQAETEDEIEEEEEEEQEEEEESIEEDDQEERLLEEQLLAPSSGEQDEEEEQPVDEALENELLGIGSPITESFDEEAPASSEQISCDIVKATVSESRMPSSARTHKNIYNFHGTQLSCGQCEEKVTALPGLEEHIKKAHFHLLPFQCENCDWGDFCLSSLRKHIMHCSKTPESKKLAFRKNLKSNAAQFPCPLCKSVFKSDVSLLTHVAGLHNSSLCFQCPGCDSKYLTCRRLVMHLKLCKNTKFIPYSPGKAASEPLTPSQLVASKHNIADKKKRFKCEHCTRSFIHKKRMLNHVKTHTKMREERDSSPQRSTSPALDRDCADLNLSDEHELSADPMLTEESLESWNADHFISQDEEEEEEADMTQTESDSESDWASVKSPVTLKKRYQCDHCPKKFVHKKRKMSHMRTHMAEHERDTSPPAREAEVLVQPETVPSDPEVPMNKDATQEAQLTRPESPPGAGVLQERVVSNSVGSNQPEKKEKRFKCDYCSKLFVYDKRRLSHMRKHELAAAKFAMENQPPPEPLKDLEISENLEPFSDREASPDLKSPKVPEVTAEPSMPEEFEYDEKPADPEPPPDPEIPMEEDAGETRPESSLDDCFNKESEERTQLKCDYCPEMFNSELLRGLHMRAHETVSANRAKESDATPQQPMFASEDYEVPEEPEPQAEPEIPVSLENSWDEDPPVELNGELEADKTPWRVESLDLLEDTENVVPFKKRKRFTCPHCPRIFVHKMGRLTHMRTHKADTGASNRDRSTSPSNRERFKSPSNQERSVSPLDRERSISPDKEPDDEIPPDPEFAENRVESVDPAPDSQPETDDLNETTNMKSPTKKGKRLKCDYCPREFIYNKRRRTHMLTHLAPTAEPTPERDPSPQRSLDSGISELAVPEVPIVPEVSEEPRVSKNAEVSIVQEAEAERLENMPLIERLYPCCLCTRVFNHPVGLRAHTKFQHLVAQSNSGDDIRCKLCPKTFKSKMGLIGHTRFEHRPSHQCKQCDKTFNDETELSEHTQHDHLEQPATDQQVFQCDACSTSFSNRTDLIAHLKEPHLDQPEPGTFQCKSCPKTFRHKQALVAHTKISHQNPDNNLPASGFRCKVCMKVFKHKKSYLAHSKSNCSQTRQAPKVLCNICKQTFEHPLHLRKHMTDVHEMQPEEEFKCSVCALFCASNFHLANHMRNKHKNLQSSPKASATQEESEEDEVQIIESNSSPSSAVASKAHGEPQDPRSASVIAVKVRIHICKVCRNSFSNEADFKRHFEQSSLCTACPSCYKFSPNEAASKEHAAKCPSLTTEMRQLFLHNLEPTMQTKAWYCKLCTHLMKSPGEVKQHVSWGENCPGLSTKAEPCDLISGDPGLRRGASMSVTWLEASNKYSVTCLDCDRTLLEVDDVSQITETSINTCKAEHSCRGFLCSLCDMMFYLKGQYEAHIKLHSSLRPSNGHWSLPR